MHYPYCFKYKGKRWNLVDLKRPDDDTTPYIILESLNSEKNSSRTIHTVVIKSEQRVFQLGRGHDSDLRINDISVSRRHASLEYRSDGFYIVDYQSKFGTLVLLSHSVPVPGDTHQTLQIGRTVVTMKFKANGGHQSYKPKENFDQNTKKYDENLKIVEIDGKRFLVRPEVEDEDDANNDEEMEDEEAKNNEFDE